LPLTHRASLTFTIKLRSCPIDQTASHTTNVSLLLTCSDFARIHSDRSRCYSGSHTQSSQRDLTPSESVPCRRNRKHANKGNRVALIRQCWARVSSSSLTLSRANMWWTCGRGKSLLNMSWLNCEAEFLFV